MGVLMSAFQTEEQQLECEIKKELENVHQAMRLNDREMRKLHNRLRAYDQEGSALVSEFSLRLTAQRICLLTKQLKERQNQERALSALESQLQSHARELELEVIRASLNAINERMNALGMDTPDVQEVTEQEIEDQTKKLLDMHLPSAPATGMEGQNNVRMDDVSGDNGMQDAITRDATNDHTTTSHHDDTIVQ